MCIVIITRRLLLFVVFYSSYFVKHGNARDSNTIIVGYDNALLISCTGAYVVDTGQEADEILSMCSLDKEGNLVLIIRHTDQQSSGNYTCKDDDASHVPTSVYVNVTRLSGQNSPSNNANIWLFTDHKCSSEELKHLTNDQRWTRTGDGEVICSRKEVIESCHKTDEEMRDDSADEHKGLRHYLAPIITASMLLFIVVIVIIGFIFLRRKRSEIDDFIKLYNELIASSGDDMAVRSDKPLREQLDNIPFDRNYEIRLNRIIIRKVKSKGRYGRVYLAELKNKQLGMEGMEVNVKGPKEAAKYDDVRSLADEAKVMMAIGLHPNVLGLIGVVIENMTRGGDLYVVVEFTLHNLKTFLHKRKDYFIDELISKDENDQTLKRTRSKCGKMQKTLGPSITTTVLCSFAYQIANGMEFLARKNCVHRDLAARNVLLRENRIVKIADFGEDRQWDYQYLIQEIQYASPYKSMARESISESRFSEKTDVWSYGVLLWEIFTLGDDPHKNINSEQKLAEYYQHGGRLPKPVYMPENVSTLMFECWQEDPNIRPTFLNCRNITQNILKEHNTQFFCWLQNQLHEEFVNMQKYAEWRDGPSKDAAETEIA